MINYRQPVLLGRAELFSPEWYKFFAVVDAFIGASTGVVPPTNFQAQLDSLLVDLNGRPLETAGNAALQKADAVELGFSGLPVVSPVDFARLDGFDLRLESVVWAAPGAYAPLVSPQFQGVPTAPTAAPGTNTNQLATCAFVATATGTLNQGGATAARPASPTLYQSYFDTTLGQPIWCKQVSPAIWVNAAGVTV